MNAPFTYINGASMARDVAVSINAPLPLSPYRRERGMNGAVNDATRQWRTDGAGEGLTPIGEILADLIAGMRPVP